MIKWLNNYEKVKLCDFDKVLPKKVGVLDENNFSGGTALFSGV